MYQPREYRRWVSACDLVAYNVCIKETDLYIRTCTNLEPKARDILKKHREALDKYIQADPFFRYSFKPLEVAENAPAIVKLMAQAAAIADVGPMAAVAGAIAQIVGEELRHDSAEIIIENGGDNYINSQKERIVAIYAGRSPLSGKIGLKLKPDEMPLGICTSSGTVSHSLSFGKADAVVVVSPSAALADAAATSTGNTLLKETDIPRVLENASNIEGITGLVIIKDGKIGISGKLELCDIDVS
jgi:ApbE superfamily uncharacterized protein (UPF0280 family)